MDVFVTKSNTNLRAWPRGTRPSNDSSPDATEASRMLKGPDLIAAIYAPAAQVARWIEGELDRDGAMVQTARSVNGLVRALVDDPGPRPNVVVVDLDSMKAGELLELHSLRQLGWFGSIIALGHAPAALRASLCINQVVAPPFVQDQLREALARVRSPAPTTRIPVIPDKK